MERLPDRIGRPRGPTVAGVTTEEDDLRNRNDITFGAGSAVDDLSGAELTGTPADREISPAASAAADGTEDPQAPRPNDGSLRVDEDTPLTAVMRDRKSTRLNSSHVAISYAVCCLTKKIRRA